MRISNSILSRAQFSVVSQAMSGVHRAHGPVMSVKRIQAARDVPTAALTLRALDQYRANVQRATSRIGIEGTVLQQVGDLLSRAQELGSSQIGSTANAQTRSVANAEVQQIFQEIVALGNTKSGSEFTFGGDQSQTPFTTTGSGATLDFKSAMPQGGRPVQHGDGQTIAIALDGKQLLLDSGVLDGMRELSRALDPASSTYGHEAIGLAMTKLGNAFDAIQTLVGDVRAKGKQLQATQTNLDAYKCTLTTFRSNLEDIDIERAVAELTSRQVAYQTAVMATSKVMGLSLGDSVR